jgi:hypothetical protein
VFDALDPAMARAEHAVVSNAALGVDFAGRRRRRLAFLVVPASAEVLLAPARLAAVPVEGALAEEHTLVLDAD